MSRYGLKRYTLLSSVHGDSNFRFLNQTGSNPITIVESHNDVHVAVMTEAKFHTSQGRAVSVFFKNCMKLVDHFYLRSRDGLRVHRPENVEKVSTSSWALSR